MHICFIYPGYPPETHAGGIGTYVYEMSNMLHKHGIKISVVSRSEKEGISHEVTDEGINLYRIGIVNGFSFNKGGHLLVYSDILKIVKKIDKLSPITVLEVCDWGGEGALLLKHFINRMVVRCHTPSFISESYNPLNRPYLSEEIKNFEKKVLSCAKRIISPSYSLLSEIEKYVTIVGEKIIEPYLINDKIIPQKEDYRIQKDKIKILTVGRIEERKGQDIIFSALRQLHQNGISIELYLIGADTPVANEYKTILKYFLSFVDKQTQKNIHFLGAFDRKSVLNMYMDYDVYVNASRFDNYPFTILEAMAAGMPIIASKNSGMQEQIKDGCNGIFFNGTAIDLKKKLMELFFYKNKRKELGQNAIRTIVDKYSSRHIVNNIKNLIIN